MPALPLSRLVGMTTSTRSTSPEYGYSFACTPASSLPSVEDVLCKARPSPPWIAVISGSENTFA